MANLNSAKAMAHLGQLSENGKGVPVNMPLARGGRRDRLED